jgi:hypothetical protein
MFGDIELRNIFGDGLDEVGLKPFTADESCVCPKSWLPASGAAILGFDAKGFLGSAGVSGAMP